MKKTIFLLTLVLFSQSVFAVSPDSLNLILNSDEVQSVDGFNSSNIMAISSGKMEILQTQNSIHGKQRVFLRYQKTDKSECVLDLEYREQVSKSGLVQNADVVVVLNSCK